MNEQDVRTWVDRYVEAWGSNDPDAIGALFSDDARYMTAPHRKPWAGRDQIVEQWLARKDEPGTWTFRFEVLAIAGELAFVRGWTVYPDEPYSNLWVIRLDADGRASEFTEWWMVASG